MDGRQRCSSSRDFCDLLTTHSAFPVTCKYSHFINNLKKKQHASQPGVESPFVEYPYQTSSDLSRQETIYCRYSIAVVRNTGLSISPWNMSENWLMPQLSEDSNNYIFQQAGSLKIRAKVSQSKPTTKVDRTHRKIRWRVNAVATPFPGFNPVRLFLLGVCEGHCLCASTPR